MPVKYEPVSLNRWTRPDHYVGAEWHDYCRSGFGRSRDSDALERANFDAALKALGGERSSRRTGTPLVIVVRENHWAVGWVEWIAIHERCSKALAIADGLQDRIADYPVLDDSLFSEYENDDCASTWDCLRPKDRIAYFREHHIIKGFRDLLAAVRGSWHHAAQLLPFPSDLLC